MYVHVFKLDKDINLIAFDNIQAKYIHFMSSTLYRNHYYTNLRDKEIFKYNLINCIFICMQ